MQGFTQILWALVGFLSQCQKISVLLEATFSYAHVLILLLFFFCIFFLPLGAVFMSLSFQFFFNLTVGLSIIFCLTFSYKYLFTLEIFFVKSLVNSE